MVLLNEVDKPGSDIDSYVTNLDKIMLEQQVKIISIRKRLYYLYTKLKNEEALSSRFSQLNDNNKVFEKNDTGI